MEFTSGVTDCKRGSIWLHPYSPIELPGSTSEFDQMQIKSSSAVAKKISKTK